MAAPTAITVTLDLDEYSKFEDDRRKMTVTWTASGGGDMSGEQLTVELRKGRRLRDQVVYTAPTVTIAGSTDPQTGTVVINLLEDPVDSTRKINKIRRGKYFVRVRSVTSSGVFGDSPDVPISIVSAQQLRNNYLFGLTLTANDVRAVKMQPTNITGITIKSLSTSHPTGFFPMTFVYQASPTVVRHLHWNGGPATGRS